MLSGIGGVLSAICGLLTNCLTKCNLSNVKPKPPTEQKVRPVQTDDFNLEEIAEEEIPEEIEQEEKTRSPVRINSFEQQPQIVELDKEIDSGSIMLVMKAKIELEVLIENNPDHGAQLLYRLGKCYHHMAAMGAPSEKFYNIQKGMGYCTEALELEEDNPEIHKWYAILVGMRADLKERAISDRISDSSQFKDHIDQALFLNPHDECLHFLKARYMFNVASLPWFERSASNTMYNARFNASYLDALGSFLKADQLASTKGLEWKENKMFVAKCFLAMHKFEKGIEWLKNAQEAKDIHKDVGEPLFKVSEEIRALLEKYDKSSEVTVEEPKGSSKASL